MLNINIGKKETIFFMAFFVMIIGIGGVIAFNSEGPPSKMGHSAEEISIDFESGRVLDGEIIPVIPGYTKNDCYLMVSIEDNHFGPNYTEEINPSLAFWDFTSNWWSDNHYAGSQSFYNNEWNVTCKFGFAHANSLSSLSWRQAYCRYLQICEK